MKHNHKLSKKSLLLLLLILIVGTVLRSINLDWGAPFFFHPDERNIASAVTRIMFPQSLNPEFFAYGSITIYCIYFLGLLSNIVFFFLPTHTDSIFLVSFERAIIVSRVLSNFYAFLSLILIFVLTSKIASRLSAFLALLLATLSIGLIQYAHFGTVESALAFYALLMCWTLVCYIDTHKKRFIILSFIVAGILSAIKVSSVFLFPLPIIMLLLSKKEFATLKSPRSVLILVKTAFISSLALLITAVTIFLITSPFAIFDWQSFKGSMDYESGVALGTIPVFYTGDFFGAFPIIYQIMSIYPFILNPVLGIFAIPILLFFILRAVSTKNKKYLVILGFFFVLFLSQAFLFTKWTRYIIPTLPFFYILAGIELAHFYTNTLQKKFPTFIIGVMIGTSLLWSLSYVITAYVEPDTRVRASEYTNVHIPPEARVASDVYDLGIIAFDQHLHNIHLIDFYDLEHNPDLANTIREQMKTFEYYIVPSQRIIASRIGHPSRFPEGHHFYTELISGDLGYTQIYQTPCSIFCSIAFLADPATMYEQTATVFDRPTVYIYKNIKGSHEKK